MRPSLGDATPGALFEVDAAGAALLDQKEGAPRFYERRSVTAIDARGREHEATTYGVTEARRELHHVPPTDAYLDVVRCGLAAHGLCAAPLERAAASLEGAAWPGEVFVYGTLRAGQSRAHMLPGARTAARVRGSLVDRGAYPGLLLGGEGARAGPVIGQRAIEQHVVGERVAVSASELERLDAVEGFLGYRASGSLFRRVVVQLEDGAWAWTYVWLGEPSPPLGRIDWCAGSGERGGADLL